MDDCDRHAIVFAPPPPAAIPRGRRRRRRKKQKKSSISNGDDDDDDIATTDPDHRHGYDYEPPPLAPLVPPPPPGDYADRQDAELEREVDSILNRRRGGPPPPPSPLTSPLALASSRRVTRKKKRPRRECGGADDGHGHGGGAGTDYAAAANDAEGDADDGDLADGGKRRASSGGVGGGGAGHSRTTLPVLLCARETGRHAALRRRRRRLPDEDGGRGAPSSWNSMVLFDREKDDGKGGGGRRRRRRLVWRPYARRSVPFSELRTPPSDAILALDRWGGYLIGIGGGGIGGGRGSSSPSSSTGGPGGGSTAMMMPRLSINFYGVPSPARLMRARDRSRGVDGGPGTEDANAAVVSPLFRTVPLSFRDPNNSIENGDFPIVAGGHYGEYASPAAGTPMRLLLSDDGSLGAAFLRHSAATSSWPGGGDSAFSESPASQDEDVLGTIVVFEPPGVARDRSCHLTKSLRCSNVRLGGWRSFTMRHALWPASLVPMKKRGDGKRTGSEEDLASPFSRCQFRRALSAHLLFNDEDDGFRMTWVTTTGDDYDDYALDAGKGQLSFARRPGSIRPSRNDIVVRTEGNVWEQCLSDPATGRCVDNDDDDRDRMPWGRPAGPEVAHEVYLQLDALLSDVISRRRSSLFERSPYRSASVCLVPEFFYDLVSASPDDLRVVVVIVFSNREKQMLHSTKKVPSALGVFVEVNLFDQSYDELKWVFNQSCNDKSSMKKWSNRLALNWRMQQSRVGVFCLDSSKIDRQMEQWVGATHESNVDEDLGDDINVDLWGDYVERRKASGRTGPAPSAPKDISMSSLYPFCDVITNRAVHSAIPVKRIASRKSPIELIYG